MKDWTCIRLDPEQRLCPVFDSCSVRKFGIPEGSEMGLWVVDNCPEEHIQ